MASLYKHLRVHQIFGANTDVGKTILTTALSRASAAKRFPVFYLKPVSTGALEDADDRHVTKFGGKASKLIHAECLFQYDEPVSPHLAARLKDANKTNVPTDDIFIKSVAERIREHAKKTGRAAHMYVETAGGVHSPALSGTTQIDCYRPLFLPIVLIGDSKLGGISSTISAYESLLLRGYVVEAIVLFREDYYRNWEYLTEYFKDRGVHVSVVDPPPARLSNPKEDVEATEKYYESIVAPDIVNGVSNLVDLLDVRHAVRVQELESMPQRTLDTIWWPFVQHGTVKGPEDVTVIDSAYGDFFSTAHPGQDNSQSILSPDLDGSASWWTQTLGHAHPALTMAAARASGRYGHVMFPQATHLPALKLAERLVHKGPGKGWASRAFFSDNGSTGMEVALKMALRAYTLRNGSELSREDKKKIGVLGLKGSYHGDTIGAMDACEDAGVYTCEWHDAKGYWLEPPSVGFKDGKPFISVPSSLSAGDKAYTVLAKSLSWIYDVEDRLHTQVARAYALYIRRALDKIEERGQKLGALVIEPLLMGAGGMIFVDPLFQRVMVDTVRGRRSGKSSEWSGMPVIFDEVFVGLNRIGVESTGPLLGVNPDISVNAKVLTGGLLPLCVTMASKSIFNAFFSDKKAEALLHGHSYTAHPIGCEVANETLAQIDKLAKSEEWQAAKGKWNEYQGGEDSKVWSLWDPQFVAEVSKLSNVKEVMSLGSVLAINFEDESAGYTSFFAQNLLQPLKAPSNEGGLSAAPGGAPYGINYRTLGNVAYFMTSLNTSSAVIRSVEDKIWKTIAN